jgi:hypothetical protein
VVTAPAQPEPEEFAESRPSSYTKHHHVEHDDDDDNGGSNSHSFMNSNLLWGVGGLAIGGLLGYMIGKNAQQPQYQFPYYPGGPMMPGGLMRPPPFGQVPGGAFSPFGYNTGGLPPQYQVGGGFGLGGNYNFQSPIYNGVGGVGGVGARPPQILPYYH